MAWYTQVFHLPARTVIILLLTCFLKFVLSSVTSTLDFKVHFDNANIELTDEMESLYYSPYFYFKTFANTKYALLIPQIAIGGYYQKLSFGITTQFGNKVPIRIGTHHLESIFKGKESKALSVYLQIGVKF